MRETSVFGIAMFAVLAVCSMNLVAADQRVTPVVTPEMDQLIRAHREVLAQMNALNKGSRVPSFDDPRMAPLLTEGWRLAGEWAAIWFDEHQNPSAKELTNLFAQFTPPPPHPKYYDEKQPALFALDGSATRIAPDVYVVAADYEMDYGTATFFIVSRNASGRFESMWSIKPLAERHYDSKDEVGLWAFVGMCAYHCGSLMVSKVLPLPATGNGMPRFGIDANQSTNGGTREAQFSVWDWDGKEAKPELIKSYNYTADYGSIHANDDIVQIVTKEPTDTIFACGMCPEPRGEWTLKLGPNGTEDLGHRFRTPEIQWADQLLTTIAASKDASSMASDNVIGAVRAAIQEERTKYPPVEGETDEEKAEEKTSAYFGMLDRCKIITRGQRGAFVIKLDDAEITFSYEKRAGRPFFTKVNFK